MAINTGFLVIDRLCERSGKGARYNHCRYIVRPPCSVGADKRWSGGAVLEDLAEPLEPTVAGAIQRYLTKVVAAPTSPSLDNITRIESQG